MTMREHHLSFPILVIFSCVPESRIVWLHKEENTLVSTDCAKNNRAQFRFRAIIFRFSASAVCVLRYFVRFFAFVLFFSFFVFRFFFLFCFVLLFLFCFAKLETSLLLANTYGYMVAQRSLLVYMADSSIRIEGKFSHSAPVYGLWLPDKPSYPHPLFEGTRAAIKMKNKHFEGVRSDSTIFYKSPRTEL